MPDKNQLTRAELIQTLEVLEQENRLLSERSEEILLMQLVGDVLTKSTDEHDILEDILERISVFLDIPYCAYCEIQSDKTIMLNSFIATSNESGVQESVDISPALLEMVKGSPHVILKNPGKESGIKLDLKQHDFVPENIALVHSETMNFPAIIFLFADQDTQHSTMARKMEVIQIIIQKTATKLENLALNRELAQVNSELEKLLQSRTNAFLESEDRFRRVISQSPSVIEIYDLEGFQVDVNKAYEKLWGFPASTTLNRFNLFRSEEVEKSGLLKYVERAYAGESVMVPEYLFNPSGETEARGKGRIRWLSTRIYPLKDINGEVKNIVISHEDVTAKKHSQEELLARESLYRGLFETSIDGICIVDNRGRYVDTNPAVESMTGYSSEELAKMEIKNLVHPEDREKSAKYLKKLIQDGSYRGYEGRLISKNGDVHYVEISSIAIYENGEFHGSHDIIRDVTERKRAEEEIRKSEERFKIIFDDAPDAYYLSNSKGVFIDGNKAAEKILGYDKDELIGKSFLKLRLLQTKDIARAARLLARNVMGKPTGPDEFTLIRKDGSFVDVEIVTHSVRIAGKALILGIARDITERKRAEESIKESESNLKAIIENSLESIWSINTDYEIQYTNEVFANSFLASFGVKIERGTNLLQALPDSIKSVWKAHYDRAFGNEHHVFEEVIDIGHTKIFIEVAVTPILLNDKVIGASFYGRDITERRLAEEVLRASEERLKEALIKATKANEVKDQFISNISHEIRTPLNSVIGFSDLLKTRFGDQLEKNERDIFGYITTAGNRLMKTVDSILNISQLEAGTISVYPVKVDLVLLVQSVVKASRSVAEENQLELNLVSKLPEAIIFVDEYSIQQAIMNLVDNALKYTFEGGVELRIDTREDRVTLSIADTGIGIDEAYQTRLFEPYTQESEGYTKKYQGIGLGMALTKRYLELNQVALELESKKNIGSTFTLIFPALGGGKHGR